MTTSPRQTYRQLTSPEIRTLESNGCTCCDWSGIRICDGTDLGLIRNVHFAGNVKIGAGVTIRNVGLLEMRSDASFGVGTVVNVLDETGSHAVRIFPGLSSQLAMLMARAPQWASSDAKEAIGNHISATIPDGGICDGAVITDCMSIRDVSVGRGVVIDGALSLRNGSIINNIPAGKGFAAVGSGVDAENFIIEDGRVESGTILRNCYVGQGAVLQKGFTAHDSLIFANCSFENGEACSLFAGPYSVSMHKSSLLIACQTSFFNAGSGTNQSNHMYKLGPLHWGILERGVKTSSGSYIMLGAKIGAYSLVMGQHKTHPDSSEFPFSYLFSDGRGATVVAPGAMLRNCGLVRDEKKWPARDKRTSLGLPPHDRIIFDVLNPMTVDSMLKAMDTTKRLLDDPGDEDRIIHYRGLKFTRQALERAGNLYQLAISKYLHTHMPRLQKPLLQTAPEADTWVDIAGLLMPRRYMELAMSKDSVTEIERVFDKALEEYEQLQADWILARFGEEWLGSPEKIAAGAAEYDRIIEEDRRKYLAELDAQNEMLSL